MSRYTYSDDGFQIPNGVPRVRVKRTPVTRRKPVSDIDTYQITRPYDNGGEDKRNVFPKAMPTDAGNEIPAEEMARVFAKLSCTRLYPHNGTLAAYYLHELHTPPAKPSRTQYGRIPLAGERVFLSYEMSAGLTHELFVYAHGTFGPPENRPICIGTISSIQSKIDCIRELLETGHSLIGTVVAIETLSEKTLYRIQFSAYPSCTLVYNIVRDIRTVDAILSERLNLLRTWDSEDDAKWDAGHDEEMPDVGRLHLEADMHME
ncbi:hypothetical protein BJ508DRAFT_324448 [Ascobolus immersus RN42]|uniref:Uncharacterized protein n=1 Tax=Ascobolus immersus RN42 TaxID=1160509 RepID=A0A3N4IGV1_ASCIM|nr:hypothetical protein BJ508DRAFT_324448 [Ascobolus immersus RN42]